MIKTPLAAGCEIVEGETFRRGGEPSKGTWQVQRPHMEDTRACVFHTLGRRISYFWRITYLYSLQYTTVVSNAVGLLWQSCLYWREVRLL